MKLQQALWRKAVRTQRCHMAPAQDCDLIWPTEYLLSWQLKEGLVSTPGFTSVTCWDAEPHAIPSPVFKSTQHTDIHWAPCVCSPSPGQYPSLTILHRYTKSLGHYNHTHNHKHLYWFPPHTMAPQRLQQSQDPPPHTNVGIFPLLAGIRIHKILSLLFYFQHYFSHYDRQI